MSITMIPCNSDCVYQKDGYCILEIPAVITERIQNGCVHHIQTQSYFSIGYTTNPPQPEMPL